MINDVKYVISCKVLCMFGAGGYGDIISLLRWMGGMRRVVSWGLHLERRPRARCGGIVYRGKKAHWGVMECWVQSAKCVSQRLAHQLWVVVAATLLC